MLAMFLGFALFLQACSGPGLTMRQVPENGYQRTLNYQFQAQVHADLDGTCKMMIVRVKPLNKMYGENEPPPRLQLFDDDCLSPLRFERVQYLSGSGYVRLSGVDVGRFLGDNFHLESVLIEWLCNEGVI